MTNTNDRVKTEANRLIEASRAIIVRLQNLLGKTDADQPPDDPDSPKVVDPEPAPPDS
jgi:hypothetical protein